MDRTLTVHKTVDGTVSRKVAGTIAVAVDGAVDRTVAGSVAETVDRCRENGRRNAEGMQMEGTQNKDGTKMEYNITGMVDRTVDGTIAKR